MAFETYVLLDSMNPPNSNIFKRISKTQRQPLDKLPMYRPYLQVTYMGEDGKNRTIRYKESTNTIFQDEQIKAGILANERFTTNERRKPTFINSVLATNNETLQTYLKTYPGFEGNKNVSDAVRRKEYKLYDKQVEMKTANQATRQHVKAVNKILELDLDGSKELMYRFYGTSYTPSEDLEENQNILINELDENDKAIEEVLKEAITTDDEATILIGKAMTTGILSFDAEIGQVSKKKGEKWINVKAISAEYSFDERKRHFAEFLTSDAGKTLWNDIEKDLKKVKQN